MYVGVMCVFVGEAPFELQFSETAGKENLNAFDVERQGGQTLQDIRLIEFRLVLGINNIVMLQK